MASLPQQRIETTATPRHDTRCQCGGTNRWLETKDSAGGEIVTAYGPCPARRLTVVAA